jgi:hypothetical protein
MHPDVGQFGYRSGYLDRKFEGTATEENVDELHISIVDEFHTPFQSPRKDPVNLTVFSQKHCVSHQVKLSSVFVPLGMATIIGQASDMGQKLSP